MCWESRNFNKVKSLTLRNSWSRSMSPKVWSLNKYLNSTCDLVRNAKSCSLSIIIQSEICRVEPSPVFNKPCMGFWLRLQFENIDLVGERQTERHDLLWWVLWRREIQGPWEHRGEQLTQLGGVHRVVGTWAESQGIITKDSFPGTRRMT